VSSTEVMLDLIQWRGVPNTVTVIRLVPNEHKSALSVEVSSSK